MLSFGMINLFPDLVAILFDLKLNAPTKLSRISSAEQVVAKWLRRRTSDSR